MHAEGVGDERLAEERPADLGLELEQEEVVVEVTDDVGLAETDPALGPGRSAGRELGAASSGLRTLERDDRL